MAITFNPAALDFGEIPATRRAVLDVEIDNQTAASVPYALAQNQDGGDRFALVGGNGSVAAHSKHTVTVRFRSDDLPASPKITGTLKAGTGSAAASLSLEATVVNPVSIEEEAVECGEALVGAELVSVVKVTNAHATLAATLSIEGGGGTFAVMPDSIPASGIPQAVWLKFQPTAEGDARATLKAVAGAFSDSAEVAGKGVLEKLEEIEAEGGGEAEQRFHIDIPNPHTYLGLGAKLHGYEASAVGDFVTSGIGLETKEDIYVNGMGPESRLWAQARKKVVIQSTEESVFSIAKEKNIMNSGEVSYVLGSKGVVISGGLPLRHEVLDPLGGELEPTSADNWAYGFIAADMAVGLVMAGLSAKSLIDDWKDTKFMRRGWEAFGTAAALGGVVGDALAASLIAPTTTVLGAAGIAIASPAYVAVYGIAGIALVSTFPTMMGLVDAAIMARDDASVLAWKGTANLKGRKVDIQADHKIEISAAMGKEHAQTYSPVSIEGSHLEITANETIVPGKTTAGHEGHIEVEAEKKLTIGVGKFLVRIETTSIHIGMRKLALDDVFDPTKPALVLDDTALLLHAAGNSAGLLDLGKDKATLGVGFKTTLTATSSGIKLRSDDVNLTADGPLKIQGGVIKLG